MSKSEEQAALYDKYCELIIKNSNNKDEYNKYFSAFEQALKSGQDGYSTNYSGVISRSTDSLFRASEKVGKIVDTSPNNRDLVEKSFSILEKVIATAHSHEGYFYGFNSRFWEETYASLGKIIVAQPELLNRVTDKMFSSYESFMAPTALEEVLRKSPQLSEKIVDAVQTKFLNREGRINPRNYGEYSLRLDDGGEDISLRDASTVFRYAMKQQPELGKKIFTMIQTDLQSIDEMSYSSACLLGEIANAHPDLAKDAFSVFKSHAEKLQTEDVYKVLNEFSKQPSLAEEVLTMSSEILSLHEDENGYLCPELRKIAETRPDLNKETLTNLQTIITKKCKETHPYMFSESVIDTYKTLSQIIKKSPELMKEALDVYQKATGIKGLGQGRREASFHMFQELNEIVENVPDSAKMILPVAKVALENIESYRLNTDCSDKVNQVLRNCIKQSPELGEEALSTSFYMIQSRGYSRYDFGMLTDIVEARPDLAEKTLAFLQNDLKTLNGEWYDMGEAYRLTRVCGKIITLRPDLTQDVLQTRDSLDNKFDLMKRLEPEDEQYRMGYGYIEVDGKKVYVIPSTNNNEEEDYLSNDDAQTPSRGEFSIEDFPEGKHQQIARGRLSEGMSYSPTMLDINELFEKGVAKRGDIIDLSGCPGINCIQAASQEQLNMLTPESKQQITEIHLSNNTPVGWDDNYNYTSRHPMDMAIDVTAFTELEKFETHFYCNDDLENVYLPNKEVSMKFQHSSLYSLHNVSGDINRSTVAGKVYDDYYEDIQIGKEKKVLSSYQKKTPSYNARWSLGDLEILPALKEYMETKESHIAEKQSQVKEWKQHRNDELLKGAKSKLSGTNEIAEVQKDKPQKEVSIGESGKSKKGNGGR